MDQNEFEKAQKRVNRMIDDLLEKAKSEVPNADLAVRQLGAKTLEQLLGEVNQELLADIKSKAELLLATADIKQVITQTTSVTHEALHVAQLGIITICYLASLLEAETDKHNGEVCLASFKLDVSQFVEANLIAGDFVCDFHNVLEAGTQIPGKAKDTSDFNEFMGRLTKPAQA